MSNEAWQAIFMILSALLGGGFSTGLAKIFERLDQNRKAQRESNKTTLQQWQALYKKAEDTVSILQEANEKLQEELNKERLDSMRRVNILEKRLDRLTYIIKLNNLTIPDDEDM